MLYRVNFHAVPKSLNTFKDDFLVLFQSACNDIIMTYPMSGIKRLHLDRRIVVQYVYVCFVLNFNHRFLMDKFGTPRRYGHADLPRCTVLQKSLGIREFRPKRNRACPEIKLTFHDSRLTLMWIFLSIC